MSRLIFVATICVIFAATGAHGLSSRKLNSAYDNINTFGFKANRQTGVGVPTVDTGHFESGPQHLVTSEFKCETYDSSNSECSTNRQFYDNVQFDAARCVTLNDAAGNHVIGFKDKDTDASEELDCPVAAYCDTWESTTGTDHGAFAQTDYCYNLKAPEVIDNLLCKASKDTSGQDPAKLAHTGSNNHYLDWCTTSSYSTKTVSRNPAISFDQTMFQIEDYDILDQQCYTLANSDKDEFTDVVCTEANHEKVNGQVKNFLENLDAALTKRDADAIRDTPAWRHAADSRYPNQEYCMNTTTLLTELFGCADDQRIVCPDDVNTEDHLADPRECAGNLDADMVDAHEDYLEWSAMSQNYYGDSTLQNYRCTVPEIAIANALSSYLDKADLDIKTVCGQAKTRFQLAYTAYVNFVDPDNFGDDNLYTVLRAAWRQAEFTLRSAKIQQQTLDRMRKYQDYIESLFAEADQGLADAPDVDTDGYAKSNSNLMTASQPFRDFRDAWDSHVKDYIDLSIAETNALVDDLQTAKEQIDNAKQYAQEIAATQISAASALASVSVHFRKKLKLWMQIEDVLETKLQDAFTSNGLNAGGENQEHVFSNMATTQQHTPLTSSFTIKKAVIGEGEAYNGAGQNRNDEDIDIAFTNGYDGVNDDRLVQVTMSDGSIETNEGCSEATVDTDCYKFRYESATNPQQTRIPVCINDKCVLPASSAGGASMDYTDNDVVTQEVSVTMPGTAGATSNSVHGSYSEADGDSGGDSGGDSSAECVEFEDTLFEYFLTCTEDYANSLGAGQGCSAGTTTVYVDCKKMYRPCANDADFISHIPNHPDAQSEPCTSGGGGGGDSYQEDYEGDITSDTDVVAPGDRSTPSISRVVNGVQASGDSNSDSSSPMCTTLNPLIFCPDQIENGHKFDASMKTGMTCLNGDCVSSDENIERCCVYTPIVVQSQLATGEYSECVAATGTKTRTIKRNIFVPAQNNKGQQFTIVDVDTHADAPTSQDGTIESTGEHEWTETVDCPVDCQLDLTCGSATSCIVQSLYNVDNAETVEGWATRLTDQNDALFNEEANVFPLNGGKTCEEVINEQHSLIGDQDHHCLGCHEATGTPQLETTRTDAAARGVDAASDGQNIRSSDIIHVQYFGVIQDEDFPDGSNKGYNNEVTLVAPSEVTYDSDLCGAANSEGVCSGANGKSSGWCSGQDASKPCIIGKSYKVKSLTTVATVQFKIQDSANQDLDHDATASVTLNPRVCDANHQLDTNGECECTGVVGCDGVCASGKVNDACGDCGGPGIVNNRCPDSEGNYQCVNDVDNDNVCNEDEKTGCQNPAACNYDAAATDADDCTLPQEYYDCNGDCLNDVDGDGVCNQLEVPGCTDIAACNFNVDATDDDGSCQYANPAQGYYCTQAEAEDQDLLEALGCTGHHKHGELFMPCADHSTYTSIIPGCKDQAAINYNELATVDDGSCIAAVPGCTDSTALNYDENANVDDESCIAVVPGCMDQNADNYNAAANVDDGSCEHACNLCTL